MSRQSLAELDAHALGVALPEDSMGELLRLDKERLIARHDAQIERLHAGIRQRAVDHQKQVLDLSVKCDKLRTSEQQLNSKVDKLMLVLAFFVMFAMYFAIRDASCPALPWIVKITQ